MSFDVAIIGYGPVGALAALSLAEAGLRVIVLERSTKPTNLPRAVGLDGETLRAFQRLGLGDEVSALCQPPRETNEIHFTNSRREKIFGSDISLIGPNGWRDILFFDQPEFEAALRRIVAGNDRIHVLLGHDVVGVSQDANGISVVSAAEGNSSETEHRAEFAIGCDGASSFVRQAIGVGWQSLGYDQDWLVLDIVQKPGANLPLATMQICDPARLASYICVKDPNRRWEFQLLEGETREEMQSPEKIGELLAPWTDPENYEIKRSAVYQFHAATADSWQVGRIFLAGDAAHQTPPFLGQGLNAGFRDAVNLGWKIPLVLAGVCDASLLESYPKERDPHARQLVHRAVSVGKLMETLAAREAGLPDPHPPESINVDIAGPIVPPMREGVMIPEQATGAQPVGGLLRQPLVRDRDGIEQRLDEYLGRGFCLVGRKSTDLALGTEAAAVFERLGGRKIALEDFQVVTGELDSVFDAHAVVVLRPDRYIFGAVDEDWNLDRLVIELGSQLRLLE